MVGFYFVLINFPWDLVISLQFFIPFPRVCSVAVLLLFFLFPLYYLYSLRFVKNRLRRSAVTQTSSPVDVTASMSWLSYDQKLMRACISVSADPDEPRCTSHRALFSCTAVHMYIMQKDMQGEVDAVLYAANDIRYVNGKDFYGGVARKAMEELNELEESCRLYRSTA